MAGLMEGTVTDFGSYDECVDIEPNDIIGRSQYCTIEMKPLLPPRPRYHNLVHGMDVFHNLSSIQGQPGKVRKCCLLVLVCHATVTLMMAHLSSFFTSDQQSFD